MWARSLASFRWVAALPLLALGCSILFPYPRRASEATSDTCHDGLDNDLDGRADCFDSDCSSFCQESSRATCKDGLDNDADGKFDCQDDDCAQFCSESDAAACRNKLDDDGDGLIDCADPDCDGQCPEESAADCADGRDNDGDTLVDAADPRCWLLQPPTVQRCAAREIDFSERFDDPYIPINDPKAPQGLDYAARWFRFGDFPDDHGITPTLVAAARGTRTGPGTSSGRDDEAAFFLGNTTGSGVLSDNLGGMVNPQVFTGPWSGFAMTLATRVVVGTALHVTLMPKLLAPENHVPLADFNDAILAVSLDGAADPPSWTLRVNGGAVTQPLSIPEVEACGRYVCQNGWATLKIAYDQGALTAVLEGASGKFSITSAPLGELELPESRLVVWGGSTVQLGAGLDDLHVRLRPTTGCGVESPQIPRASCDSAAKFPSVGQAVAVARDSAGQYCALLTAAGESLSSAADSVTAWSSSDGASWAPAASSTDPAFALPPGAVPVGVGLTHDGTAFQAAVVVRDASGARLGVSSATKCSAFSQLLKGPRLPSDAEAPSYLITNGRHEVYFTRPPTDDASRTLWRLSGPDQAHLQLEPEPIAELPVEARVSPPAAITRAGSRDLLLVYPMLPDQGAPGLGVLIGSSDARSWLSLPREPLLEVGDSGSFDGDGAVAGALAFQAEPGVLLYGGTRQGKVAAGVARIWPFETEPEDHANERCGDGACDAGESCANCAADCPCDGTLVGQGFAAGAKDWQIGPQDNHQLPYLDEGSNSLCFSPGQGWATLDLEKPIIGDFELSFDVRLPDSPASACGSLFVGLGEIDDADWARPLGIFARLTAKAGRVPCLGDSPGFALTPFVNTGQALESSLDWYAPSCAGSQLRVDPGALRHVTLTRKAGQISVGVLDDNGCPQTASFAQTLAVPRLGALLVATLGKDDNFCLGGGSAEVSNVALRVADASGGCDKGLTSCGKGGEQRSCVDTQSTVEHCGACNSTCKPGSVCVKGECQCPPELLDCADECADPSRSRLNCGSCGNGCAKYCLLGQCDAGESCADAMPLPSGSGTYTVDLSAADVDYPTYCQVETFRVYHDVVFRWSPDHNGVVHFRVQSAWQGPARLIMQIAENVSCSDFSRCDGVVLNQERIDTPVFVQAGLTYYIVVGLYAPETGGETSFQIEVGP
jgi:hypothetical protein